MHLSTVYGLSAAAIAEPAGTPPDRDCPAVGYCSAPCSSTFPLAPGGISHILEYEVSPQPGLARHDVTRVRESGGGQHDLIVWSGAGTYIPRGKPAPRGPHAGCAMLPLPPPACQPLHGCVAVAESKVLAVRSCSYA
jgi:hypothetical protein